MDTVIAKNQSHRVSMFWIILIVPGSPVSNLLALLGLRPRLLIPIIAVRAFAFQTTYAPSFRFPVGRCCSSPAQNALLPGRREHFPRQHSTTAFDSFRQLSTALHMFDTLRHFPRARRFVS